MSSRIVIVGGGLAGLSAAVALTGQGLPCTLLESRPRLGGRASSFHDPASGMEIDNCQHVSMGCCTNFRHFCQTTGLAEYFQRESTLNFIGPSGKVDRFSAGPFPAPFHLASAFAGLSYLNWADKLALAKGLKALAQPVSDQDEERPFSEWLHKHRQTDAAIERFWLVVLVSALSESLDKISLRHARKVFVDGFIANRDGWYVDIPTVPLDELYGGRLTEWLASRGTTIRLQSSVEKIELNQGAASGVRLVSQDVVAADELIVAVPFFRVKSLLPQSLAEHPDLAGVDQLVPAPISSIHLWFDRSITPLRHAVLIERLCQWVFNRTAIGTDAGAGNGSSDTGILLKKGIDPLRVSAFRGHNDTLQRDNLLFQQDAGLDTKESSHYYQIVISASHGLAERGKDVILREVLAELAAIWPATAEAKLLHSRHVTEHRAVFSPGPGVDLLRPVQQSPIENMQWAGDWTRTGWPATMEGAVRSGYLAAENVLKRLGRTEEVLQPDLPISLLSKWLFGLHADR